MLLIHQLACILFESFVLVSLTCETDGTPRGSAIACETVGTPRGSVRFIVACYCLNVRGRSGELSGNI